MGCSDLAAYLNASAAFAFTSWDEALTALVALGEQQPRAVIIDEFPYLTDASPALPSTLREVAVKLSERPAASRDHCALGRP
jgi:hypothetical protein